MMGTWGLVALALGFLGGLQILAFSWSLILLCCGMGLGLFVINLKSGVELGFYCTRTRSFCVFTPKALFAS
ncbi:MAG: hypothetical protein C5S38_09955 [Candidatus Methanophagaceae archaeon]|nr:MAG: hypothetical protein C5S38_09955 [Methanophagales archaeon]